MGFGDKLKKLNIVRAGGVATTYKSAKDRPMSMQDDMFIGRDQTNPENGTPPPEGKQQKEQKKHSHLKSLIACSILSLVFILLSLTTTIAWLFIVIWLLMLIYFWLLFLGKIKILFGFSLVWLLVIVSVFTFILILLTQSESSGDGSSSGKKVASSKSLTSEQCKPYYEKYNGKVLKVNSDGLEGTIAIKIDASNGCKLLGWYNVLLSYGLPANNYTRDIGPPAYNYVVLLRPNETDKRTKYDGYGALMGAYKNVTQLPDVYAEGRERSALYSDGAQRTDTRYFYWGYKIDTDFTESRYNEIFKDKVLQIVDGLPYIEEEAQADGGYSWGVNTDKAAVDGTIVKSYTLSIE